MATLARSIYGLGLEADVAITGLKGLRVPDRIDVSLALGRMPPDLDGMPEPSAADFYVSDDRDERGVPGVKVARLAGGAYFRIAYADGALEDFGDRFNVQPACPRVRLWPDAVEALFGAPDALPRITPGWEKRYLALDNAHHRFQASPLELRAVYLLGERAEEGGATRV